MKAIQKRFNFTLCTLIFFSIPSVLKFCWEILHKKSLVFPQLWVFFSSYLFTKVAKSSFQLFYSSFTDTHTFSNKNTSWHYLFLNFNPCGAERFFISKHLDKCAVFSLWISTGMFQAWISLKHCNKTFWNSSNFPPWILLFFFDWILHSGWVIIIASEFF